MYQWINTIKGKFFFICASIIPIKARLFLHCLLRGEKLDSGKGSYIHKTAQIIGRRQVKLGKNSCISERTWLNVNDRNLKKVAIHIGDNCFIGRDNFFTSGNTIFISDYCLTTIGCRFVGSSHNIDNQSLPIMIAGTTFEDNIFVGANCFFGADATVLGNVSIGHGSVVGARALVLNDIPPFSMAVGSPAKVIKRYSFKKKKWVDVSSLKDDDLSQNPSEKDYLESLVDAFPKVPLPWIASGSDMGSF